MFKTHVEPQATEHRRVVLLLSLENLVSFLWSESVDHRNMWAFGDKTYISMGNMRENQHEIAHMGNIFITVTFSYNFVATAYNPWSKPTNRD